ncbi:MAG: hypothetical protein HYY13_10955 [Nitrospirae bacterium]|nr:hypothetical protein [Nitrospirota bacterium]
MKSGRREVGKSRDGRGRISVRIFLLTAHCLLLTSLIGAACGLDPGDPTLIDKPRILAVRAEPPEVQAGWSVELSALVAWPDSTGVSAEDVRLDWIACRLAGRVTGQGCADPSSIAYLGSTTAGEKFIWALPVAVTTEVAPRQTVLVGLGATVGNAQLKAFKRLIIAAGDTPNLNPMFAEVRFGDVTVGQVSSYRPGQEYGILAALSEDSAQTYVEPSPSGDPISKVEEPYVSWFATAGHFDKDRTFLAPHEVTWTAPDSPPEGGRITFHAVVHDGREGSAWVTWTAEPASD